MSKKSNKKILKKRNGKLTPVYEWAAKYRMPRPISSKPKNTPNVR